MDACSTDTCSSGFEIGTVVHKLLLIVKTCNSENVFAMRRLEAEHVECSTDISVAPGGYDLEGHPSALFHDLKLCIEG